MKEQTSVIIVGNGAREHSIGRKLRQSPGNPQLLFAPGNAGTARIGTNIDVDPTDIGKIVGKARGNKAFIVVGPEAPLEKGIANAAKEAGLRVFGPTQEAARLETSKWWAIEFMRRHKIPHPDSVSFTNVSDTLSFLKYPKWKEVVIKADALASGKGVFLPSTKEEEVNAIERIMIQKEFGINSRVIIQERLKGKEISLLAMTDGETIVPLLPAQDHKRINDGDEGPNTGGMGAFAPVPMIEGLYQQIHDTILRPTVDGMREEGNLFQGVLYVGLMLTDNGPKVLEFNVRFGDPETQPLMMLLNSDLLRALKNTAAGKLKTSDIVFRKGASVCVVLAAEGYPGKPVAGDEIFGLDSIDDSDTQIIHGATVLRDGKVETSGGRAISVVSYGRDILDAKGKAYSHIGENGVHFRGMHYREDIGA